jgi:hypothetical protein
MLKNGNLLVKQQRSPAIGFGLLGKWVAAQHGGKGAPAVYFP